MQRGGKGKMCVKNRFFYDHILRLNMEEHSHVNNPESRPRPFPNLSRTITRYSHPDLPWAAASRGDPDAPPPPPIQPVSAYTYLHAAHAKCYCAGYYSGVQKITKRISFQDTWKHFCVCWRAVTCVYLGKVQETFACFLHLWSVPG